MFRRATPEAPFATPMEVLAEDAIGSPQLPGFAAVVGELIPAVR